VWEGLGGRDRNAAIRTLSVCVKKKDQPVSSCLLGTDMIPLEEELQGGE
jgi:hypothetical protein